jgi:hypothetical protein
MPTSNRSVFPRSSTSDSVTSRTAVYGPVRTVVWQGSVGDRRPYADQVPIRSVMCVARYYPQSWVLEVGLILQAHRQMRKLQIIRCQRSRAYQRP